MPKQGLSAAALKWLALASMLIDHAALVFYKAGLRVGAPPFGWKTYVALRCVGRPSFPLYAFLLAESFFHTRSRARYLLRLALFALLSELPFDLAFFSEEPYWKHQNVFWTLLLGFAALWLFERATGGDHRGCGMARAALGFAAVGAMAVLAHLARTDYEAWGVLAVAAMGVFRAEPAPRDLLSAAALYAAHPIEVVSCVDFALFRLYNGRRGRQPKYFFYLFYPGHLLLLCLLRRWVYGS